MIDISMTSEYIHIKESKQLLCYHHNTLQWRHNERNGVSNHQPHDCILKRLFRRRSKKTSKLRVTGLCEGNSRWPVKSPHKGPVTRIFFHLMTSSWQVFVLWFVLHQQSLWIHGMVLVVCFLTQRVRPVQNHQSTKLLAICRDFLIAG